MAKGSLKELKVIVEQLIPIQIEFRSYFALLPNIYCPPGSGGKRSTVACIDLGSSDWILEIIIDQLKNSSGQTSIVINSTELIYYLIITTRLVFSAKLN